jgi:hypothetical protein
LLPKLENACQKIQYCGLPEKLQHSSDSVQRLKYSHQYIGSINKRCGNQIFKLAIFTLPAFSLAKLSPWNRWGVIDLAVV